MTSSDVGKLAETVRDDMLKALREISSSSEHVPRPGLHRESSDDSTVPLTSAMDGRDSVDHSYGASDGLLQDTKGVVRATNKYSELRRRVSQGDDSGEGGEEDTESANTRPNGQVLGESREGTEDELEDDGAVIVKRP
jgi:hypothetical protein